MTAPRERTSLAAVNAMPPDAFVARFGDVAEHAPWVAASAAASRPFHSVAGMVAAFAAAVETAPRDRQMALLCAHPDLAGRAAIAGDIARASREEQAGVGLDRLTPEEYARFHELNREYRERHGIPFIVAVRGATKADVLAAFVARIGGTPEAEFEIALRQVCRIIAFRLEDRVEP